MIAASIDIGTNTTLALLAENSAEGLHALHDELTPNRLGEALRNGQIIDKETIVLNVDLLAEIVRDYKRMGAEEFAVCATSALRVAQNRLEFVKAVQEILGLKVEILSGEQEAKLTYAGVISSREIFPNERVFVMDLGGGSTEIIQGVGTVAGQSISLDLGAVYLTSDIFTDDPPTSAMMTEVRGKIRKKISNSLQVPESYSPWILVGGTATTLGMLKNGMRTYDPLKIGGTYLNRADIQDLLEKFTGKNSQELQNLPGMPVGRGKYILAGTLLLDELFELFKIEEGVISERGLRHGVWLSKFGNKERV